MPAKVQLSYARVSTRSRSETGSTMPVTDAPLLSETIISSASSQQFTITPPDSICFGRVVASGGAVYVAIDLDASETPNALANPRVLIPDGGSYWFAPAKGGIEVSIADA